jgi:Glycosyltransferase family 87
MVVPHAAKRIGTVCVILGILVFLLIAAFHPKTVILQGVDFKTVYSSSKCLLDRCNPYDSADLRREYVKGHGDVSPASDLSAFRPYQALYPPSSLFWVLPFALLPWKPAVILWVIISGLLFATAALLMADLCNCWTSPLPQALLGLFVATSSMLLTTAQPSGLAISLCAIGVWSLIRNRALTLGTICFSLSLALKPQIGGLALIYFLLAGGSRRGRVFTILLVAALFCVPGVLWAATVPAAAHWLYDMTANLAGSATRGSINDPGPTNFNAPTVTNLQSVVAVFDDVPRVYNPITWATVGFLLLIWAYVAWRAVPSLEKDLLGVAAIACLCLLPIYHRHYDVRLLILTFPAVAMLIKQGRTAGVLAVLASLAVIGGSHPTFLRDHLHLQQHSLGALKTIFLLHTSPLILLFSGIFYLTYFARFLYKEMPA